MKKYRNKIGRYWLYFRQGHSIYFVYALSFVNFILIFYNLFVERVSFLKELLPRMHLFVIVFLIFYIPLATYVGYLHRKTQLKLEMGLSTETSPYFSKLTAKERALYKAMYELCKEHGISTKELEKFLKG